LVLVWLFRRVPAVDERDRTMNDQTLTVTLHVDDITRLHRVTEHFNSIAEEKLRATPDEFLYTVVSRALQDRCERLDERSKQQECAE